MLLDVDIVRLPVALCIAPHTFTADFHQQNHRPSSVQQRLGAPNISHSSREAIKLQGETTKPAKSITELDHLKCLTMAIAEDAATVLEQFIHDGKQDF